MPDVSLSQFVALLNQTAAQFPSSVRSGLDGAGRRMAGTAQGYLGEYQDRRVGPFGHWPMLSPRTVDEKTRLGYSPPDNPLLRTGMMRQSIGHTVDRDSVTIGSTDPVARYQEFGTVNMPPRAFIGRAVAERGREEGARVLLGALDPLIRGGAP